MNEQEIERETREWIKEEGLDKVIETSVIQKLGEDYFIITTSDKDTKNECYNAILNEEEFYECVSFDTTKTMYYELKSLGCLCVEI